LYCKVVFVATLNSYNGVFYSTISSNIDYFKYIEKIDLKASKGTNYPFSQEGFNTNNVEEGTFILNPIDLVFSTKMTNFSQFTMQL